MNGPIASISTGGLAIAANVDQDTAATVGGSAQSLSGQLGLTIVNANLDDYGSYAGDQIDDAWQMQYFGQPPNPNAGPTADVSRTGQNNLFKYVAGLNPLDGSRFTLAIAPVPGQPGQKSLSFNPVVAGRSYVITATTNLVSGAFTLINGFVPTNNGATQTIVDLSAAGPARYYHVEVTKT